MKQLRVISVSLSEAIVALFLLTGLAIYVGFSVVNSEGYLGQYFSSLSNQATSAYQYQQLSHEINSSVFAGNAAVFVFWAVIGLILYYLAYFFSIEERNVAEFFKTLLWPGTDKASLLEYEFARMAIRVGGVILLLLGVALFVRTILPYILVTLNITTATSITSRLPDITLTLATVLVSFHIVVVLIRCILLRERIFY